MLLVLVKLDLFREVVQIAVDPHADIAAFLGVGKHLFVHSLLSAHNGSEDQKTRALGKCEDAVDDLVGCLLTDFLAANGTVRNSDPRIKQAEIIVYFGYRSDSRTRILRSGFLINRNRGRQPFDGIDIRLVELPEKHSRIGGQRLDKAAVSLGINGIKRQRGLSRSGKSRQHNQFVTWNIDVNVFQIVYPHTADGNLIRHNSASFLQFTASVKADRKIV
jgi:hypothetical protein